MCELLFTVMCCAALMCDRPTAFNIDAETAALIESGFAVSDATPWCGLYAPDGDHELLSGSCLGPMPQS